MRGMFPDIFHCLGKGHGSKRGQCRLGYFLVLELGSTVRLLGHAPLELKCLSDASMPFRVLSYPCVLLIHFVTTVDLEVW